MSNICGKYISIAKSEKGILGRFVTPSPVHIFIRTYLYLSPHYMIQFYEPPYHSVQTFASSLPNLHYPVSIILNCFFCKITYHSPPERISDQRSDRASNPSPSSFQLPHNHPPDNAPLSRLSHTCFFLLVAPSDPASQNTEAFPLNSD
jgi:hypothetical protein